MPRVATKDRAKPRALPQAPPVALPEPQAAASVVDLFNPSPLEESVVNEVAPMPAAEANAAPARAVAKSGGVGGKLAKPGFGFHMRTADGEESVAPYRSLEDLLSAAKNVLRGAAKSPDPIWFSIQPLDLATIDADAA